MSRDVKDKILITYKYSIFTIAGSIIGLVVTGYYQDINTDLVSILSMVGFYLLIAICILVLILATIVLIYDHLKHRN